MGNIYQDYLNKIINFNSDKNLIALRERYSEPSFFEIISKERSETTYSSFLKWLFQLDSSHKEIVSPIMMFLDILVKRSFQQDEKLVNSDLRKAILSRKLKISDVRVESEQPVSTLAGEAIGKSNTDNDILKGIVLYCQDRIDIFVECNIEIDNTKKTLQIIIENKIDSIEGGEVGGKRKIPENLRNNYFKNSQTSRYYIGTNRTDDEIFQIYVYLTPLSSHKLTNFGVLKDEQRIYDSEDEKKKIKRRVLRDDEHFIQINYQDILDGIIVPLLASSSVSTRTHFFLEEFKNQLMFPNIDDFNEQSCIAISKETSDAITELWKKYRKLIIDSIMASTLTGNEETTNFWIIDGKYFDHQPRVELLKMLINKNLRSSMNDVKGSWIEDKDAVCDERNYIDLGCNNLLYRKSISFSSITNLAGNNDIKIECDQKGKGLKLSFNSTSDECALLKSFYEENSSFFYAFMDAIKEDEREKVECFFNYLTKKNRTKYTVFYDDKCWGTNMGYSMTAFTLIRLWANENPQGLDLIKLNKEFPRKINRYYERGKWFKNLLYPYNKDGKYDYDDQAEGPVQGNWDFYPKDSRVTYHFNVNGTEVTLLKMWHEEEVESLIRYIADTKEKFAKKIKIIRSS